MFFFSLFFWNENSTTNNQMVWSRYNIGIRLSLIAERCERGGNGNGSLLCIQFHSLLHSVFFFALFFILSLFIYLFRFLSVVNCSAFSMQAHTKTYITAMVGWLVGWLAQFVYMLCEISLMLLCCIKDMMMWWCLNSFAKFAKRFDLNR